MKRYLSAKYVEHFRCIGSACGARCCRRWTVGLTAKDRQRLERAEREFDLTHRATFLANDPKSTKVSQGLHVYRLRFNEKDECPHLLMDRSCEVHSIAGSEALPDLCAQYPREVNLIGEHSEVWATLACPEAARACLFVDDGADWGEVEEDDCFRYVNNVLEVTQKTSDYRAYLDEVRRGIVQLLSQKRVPLRTRLFAVAYLGHRTSKYFNENAQTVDRRRLMADLKSVSEVEFLQGLNRELDTHSVPGNYAMSLIASILDDNRADVSTVDTVLAPEQSAPSSVNQVSLTTEKWLQTWLEFSLNRLRWEKDYSTIVDRAFENYSKVFWMKDWYVHSPNLLVHAVACILRVSVMRYRLFNSERLYDLSEQESETEKRECFEQVLLDVVTETSRMLDHDREFRTSLHAALAKRKMEDLAHACILLMV